MNDTTMDLYKVIIKTTNGRTMVFFNVLDVELDDPSMIKMYYLKRKSRKPGVVVLYTHSIMAYYSSPQDAPVFGSDGENQVGDMQVEET